MTDLPIRGVPRVGTKFDLRNFVISNGPYEEGENTRIFEKWFADAPRYLFRAVDKKYGISRRRVCDVGSAYGMNLPFCLPGSYGIEVEDYEVQFAKALGLTVFKKDVVHDDVSDLPKADVVWCSAVLEHIDPIHTFLRKLHSLLTGEGLLALYVPTIPLVPYARRLPGLGRYFTGHLHGDHLNAFVPATLKFFCERAGFRTIEVSPFYPQPLSLLNVVPGVNRLIDGCVYIGVKQVNWEYPENATRRVADDPSGYTFRGQFSHLRRGSSGE